MKHLLVVAATFSVCAPLLAQPNPGDPVQLRNPHRRGGFGGPMMGGGGGFGSFDARGASSSNGGGFASPPGNGYYGGNPGYDAQVPAPPAPPVSMFADGPYLFILRGDTLMQFDKKTLKMLKSVELPRPVAPPTSTQGDVKTYTAPPLRPGTDLRVKPQYKLGPQVEHPTPTFDQNFHFHIGPAF